MTPLAAILLLCPAGDRDVAATVYNAAVQTGVEPKLALSAACAATGLQGRNPLGVWVPVGYRSWEQCHKTGKFDTANCTQLGVEKLDNDLRQCKGSEQCALQSSLGTAKANKAWRLLRVLRKRT